MTGTTDRKSHSRAFPKQPSDIDRLVGSRMRQQRVKLGITQEGLAELLGVTFQQVQKYEKGANRIGAGRLATIAQALKVPVSYFFGNGPGEGPNAGAAGDASGSSRRTREGVTLANAFAEISDPSIRKALILLAQAASAQERDIGFELCESSDE